MDDFKYSSSYFQITYNQKLAILGKVLAEKRIFSEYSSEFLGFTPPLFLSLF